MEIITETGALEAASRRLATGGFVTVDTEFMRDSTYWPILCLMQMAGPGGEACIIDPLADGLDLAPFYELMRDRNVVKVFHAARQDIEIFYHDAGVIPDPLFDSQVAAMVCGFGDSVGYDTLVRKLTGGTVDKSSRFSDWSRRPLTDRQLKYALQDVTHLREVYTLLAKRLTESGRSRWVAEEMSVLQDPETYELRPEDAWRRLKSRTKGRRALGVLIEVAAWRERQAQERDLPRNRVIKDDALYELANHPPRNLTEMNNLRAVPKGFANSRAASSLIEAVRRGLDMPEDRIPVSNGAPPTPPGIGPLIELLKVLLKMKCEQHDVAQKLVATVADLERIAADDRADVPALSGWRREAFGNAALDLKHGRLAIGMRGKKLTLIPAQTGEPAEPAAG